MSETSLANFYALGNMPRPEIIEGLLREEQIVALAGPYAAGKSPLLADFTVHSVHGIPWCSRVISQRPVIAFDLETPGNAYRANIERISTRFGVSPPQVDQQLDPYLYLDDMKCPNTAKLHEALASSTDAAKFTLLEVALAKKPNALVLFDPVELMFRLDKLKPAEILKLYSRFRAILSKFPNAAILSTFNLRKFDRKHGRCNLLGDPRGWLDEVCGSLDLLNRCDVRLGIDEHGEAKVLNGLRRGESMTPTIMRSVEVSADEYAGFEVAPNTARAELVLTKTEMKHWNNVPNSFTFGEGEKVVPHTSLDRLVKKCVRLGLLAHEQDRYAKSKC
jgi:hypothetical protein